MQDKRGRRATGGLVRFGARGDRAVVGASRGIDARTIGSFESCSALAANETSVPPRMTVCALPQLSTTLPFLTTDTVYPSMSNEAAR